MSQHDYNIANQSFPSFRTDLNNALSAINSSNSGDSRPSGAVAGTIWVDTSGGVTAYLLKFFDGTDDITMGTINTTANTIDWSDSSITLGANSVDSDQYVDGSIDTIHIGDDQITLAKMASGTNGNIISYDTSGNPVAVATGTSGQVLTSAGAGAVPSFQTIAAGGKIGQVVTATTSTLVSNTSSTYADVGLSASITPSATSSKIFVMVSASVGGNTGTSNNVLGLTRLVRTSTEIAEYVGVRIDNVTGLFGFSCSYTDLDSPSTASAVTYKVQQKLESTGDGRAIGFCFENRLATLTLMEVLV